MRINLISSKTFLDDVKIVQGLLHAVYASNASVEIVQYSQPQCREAEVNIFIGVMNPCLLSYAAKNIWILNHTTTYRTWVPYMHMVHEIWVKSSEAERLVTPLTPTKVRNIGWTSFNKQTPSKKNYYKGIVPLNGDPNREILPILHAYQTLKVKDPSTYYRLPSLTVTHNQQISIPNEISDRITVVTDASKYDEILNDAGLCICLSKAESFCHSVNEAMASGCNIICSKIEPFVGDIVGLTNLGAFFCEPKSVDPNEAYLGDLVSSDSASLIEVLEEYLDKSFAGRKEGSEYMRRVYEENHKRWLTSMMDMIPNVLTTCDEYNLKDTLPKEEDLPDVSIVCVTRDRRAFMPILKYSYMIQSYPEDKMELVIVDDGDDSIEDTLFGVPNVTYVRLDEKKTIGEKRNIGISNAMYDVIAFMDDDDVYPNNSILERVAMMLKTPAKQCVFSSVIPCYDITRYSSFMNAPPISLPMSQRVSEATLTFTKQFWQERDFGNIQIAEGDAFIRGREYMCRELSPQEVIVSLVHPKNTSSRKIPEFKEPNGCHFGFNEKLFAMVSEIGESLKTKD